MCVCVCVYNLTLAAKFASDLFLILCRGDLDFCVGDTLRWKSQNVALVEFSVVLFSLGITVDILWAGHRHQYISSLSAAHFIGARTAIFTQQNTSIKMKELVVDPTGSTLFRDSF